MSGFKLVGVALLVVILTVWSVRSFVVDGSGSPSDSVAAPETDARPIAGGETLLPGATELRPEAVVAVGDMEGVPVGYPPSTAGAVTAAVNWVAAFPTIVRMGPIRLNDTIGQLLSERQAAAGTEEVVADYFTLIDELGADFASRVWIDSPLQVELVEATDAAAAVAVWSVLVTGDPESGPVEALWRTHRISLVWEGGDWRIDGVSITEGPTPVPNKVALPSPPAGATEWWPAPLPVAWPSSAVFSVVNTQKRKTVRASARDLVALQRVAEIPAIADDEALNTQVGDDIREAKDRLVRHLRSAFQHVVYLKQETGANGSTYRLAGTEKITKDNETALNGQHVWAYLVEAQKTYAVGDFDKVALLHQLQLHPGTWGQPLQKIRDDFYKTPRLSLLPSGDADLQRAIFDAVQAGDVRVLTSDGQEAHASSPSEVNLSSTYTLEKPVDPDAVVPDFVGMAVAEAQAKASQLGLELEVSGTGVIESQSVAPGTAAASITALQVVAKAAGGGGGSGVGGGSPTGEKQITFSKQGITFGDPSKNEALYTVFMRIAEAAEQGGNGGATFMQVQLRLTGGSSYVEELAASLEEAGIEYNITDVG